MEKTSTNKKEIIISFGQNCSNNPKQKILIENGAFGSGEHETTQTCLDFLCEMEVNRKAILDIGTGTGILGLAAIAMGAKYCFGYDPFWSACQTAQKNIRKNHIHNFYLIQSYEDAIKGTFDIVIANVYYDVVFSINDFIDKSINKNGNLIISGIPFSENYSVRNIFENKNYKVIKNKFGEEYTSILFHKEV